MPYHYCESCDAEMKEPSVEQLIEDDYCCPYCDQLNGTLEDPHRMALRMILERLESLERKNPENVEG